MERKVIVFFISMLLILSIIPIVNSGKSINENISVYVDLTNEFFSNHPLMNNSLRPDSKEASPKPKIGNPPDEFNWKNHQGRDWTTPVKDQGKIGSCWACSAVAALESVINIGEGNAELDLDLSEQYILSCLPSAGSAMTGGSAYMAYKYIMDTSPEGNYYNGIIPETCFPYQAREGVPCSDKCSDWVDHLIPINNYGFWFPDGSPEDRDRIKNQIMEKGPVVTSMFVTKIFQLWCKIFHKPTNVFESFKKTSGSNHAVILVGWKDDSKVKNGGYWIVENTWGEDRGYDGFFNIAYGCLGIDSNDITWVEYDSDLYDSPPVADAGGPYSGSINEDIVFNASNSFDSEGGIVSYEWDFGDGNFSSGEIVTHNYSQSGVYKINLTVTDESGFKDYDEITAIIDFWQIGDSWTYKADLYLDFRVIGLLRRFLTFSSNNLVFKVIGETDDTYLLKFNGSGSGFFKFLLLIRPVRSINITGEMIFRKSDIGIMNYNISYDGKIGLLKIPIISNMNVSFNPVWQIFPFPFYSDKQGCLTYSNTTNNCSLKISKIANERIINYYYPHGPFEYTCEGPFDYGLKGRSMKGSNGPYSTYHVKSPPFKYHMFEYYYSPDIRNVLKFSIVYNKYPNARQKYFSLDLELISSNVK